MSESKYAIRRTLLHALLRYEGPQDLNTLCNDPRMMELDADETRIVHEWDEMTERGYLLPVTGWPEYRKLDPALRARLAAGESMLDDPFLSGPSALR